jgi:uncharacterized membrane protein
MTNLIVMSFPNEAQAIAASHKLIELESFGDISIYEKGMIKKNAYGDMSVLQSDTTEGLRTFSGMALGTVVGALGGPVGMMIGMLTGSLTGAILDVDHSDFSEDFVSKASNHLHPGSVAIIAEISEDDPSILDSVFAEYGANITRSDVDYAHDDYEDEQVAEFDKEIADERANIKSAATSEKAKIQEKIAKLKEKRRQRIASLKARHKSGVANFKLNMKDAKESRLNKRILEHQTKINELEEKLKELDKE